MAKKNPTCKTCKSLTDVHPKESYGVCQRARNAGKNKSPYRHFDDSCPSHPDAERKVK